MSVLMVSRQLDHWLIHYRRTWKGSVVSSFIQPVLYLGAMGLLLGQYVDEGGGDLGGAPSYLAFVAPGLLAAQAMTVANAETTWPVLGAIKWDRFYWGMVASPLRPLDVVVGHLLFATFRIALTCLVFVLVMVPFGLFSSFAGVVACFAAAVLTGLAFAAPTYAFSAGTSSEQSFIVIYRVVVMPLFLFSGAFFPITSLPEALQWVARLTPLWHGVELCRMASLGQWDAAAAAVSVAYLVTLVVVGLPLAVRRLDRRLIA